MNTEYCDDVTNIFPIFAKSAVTLWIVYRDFLAALVASHAMISAQRGIGCFVTTFLIVLFRVVEFRLSSVSRRMFVIL